MRKPQETATTPLLGLFFCPNASLLTIFGGNLSTYEFFIFSGLKNHQISLNLSTYTPIVCLSVQISAICCLSICHLSVYHLLTQVSSLPCATASAARLLVKGQPITERDPEGTSGSQPSLCFLASMVDFTHHTLLAVVICLAQTPRWNQVSLILWSCEPPQIFPLFHIVFSSSLS